MSNNNETGGCLTVLGFIPAKIIVPFGFPFLNIVLISLMNKFKILSESILPKIINNVFDVFVKKPMNLVLIWLIIIIINEILLWKLKNENKTMYILFIGIMNVVIVCSVIAVKVLGLD